VLRRWRGSARERSGTRADVDRDDLDRWRIRNACRIKLLI